METLPSFEPSRRGAISCLYNLLSNLQNPSLETLRSAWEGDLGLAVAAEQWRKALEGVLFGMVLFSSGCCTAFISLKIKLSKMFPGVDSTCDRCKVSPASLAHSFWHCPKLSTYWNSIFGTLSDVSKW